MNRSCRSEECKHPSNMYRDSQICPICSEPNFCTVESGNCWCFQVNVPQELLERVPSEKKDKACLCQSCIERAQYSESNKA